LLIGVAGNTAEAFGKGLCVAMFATGTDLEASTQRVPSSLGPLNLGMLTHRFVYYIFSQDCLVNALVHRLQFVARPARRQVSIRHPHWDYLVAMAPVDAKIGIQGQNRRCHMDFREPDKTGIG
jgi:hypothetical protein